MGQRLWVRLPLGGMIIVQVFTFTRSDKQSEVLSSAVIRIKLIRNIALLNMYIAIKKYLLS